MVSGVNQSQNSEGKRRTSKSGILQKVDLEVKARSFFISHHSPLTKFCHGYYTKRKNCPAQNITTVCSTTMKSQSQCGQGLKILVDDVGCLALVITVGPIYLTLFPKISYLASNQYAPFLSPCTASGSYLLMSEVKVSPMQKRLSQCNMSQYSALFGV